MASANRHAGKISILVQSRIQGVALFQRRGAMSQ
jgi:hypothetical protein